MIKFKVLIHTKNKNFYFAKEDLELIKNIEKNIDNNNKKIQEEQKAETPKPNIYKNIFQMKENGVDYFKNNKFKEALSLFTQAKNLIEKEFSPEINCKHHLIFELYIKILKNEVLSLYNLNDFQQADEKLDFILTILPEDEKILELKATNYQSIGTCNIKTLGLNFDPLMKAQEILRKLIEKSISEKDKYQKQLLSIQNEILMKDPEYKKTQKYLEEFEKQCQILEKNHEKFFIYLKVNSF